MNSQQLSETLSLEEDCPDCGGTGRQEFGKESFRCDDCKGRGKVMTEEGKKLMEFVWTHMND